MNKLVPIEKSGKLRWVCDKCGKQINTTGSPEMGAMIGKYCHCIKGFSEPKIKQLK
jgi:hypothetical protein